MRFGPVAREDSTPPLPGGRHDRHAGHWPPAAPQSPGDRVGDTLHHLI